MTSSLWRNTSLGLFYLNWLFGLFKGLIWGIRGIGLTDPEFSLKVSLVMRPCDGTSGLVRGNRRKAVFAFKGSNWINHLNLLMSRLLSLKAVDSNAITILV